MTGLLQDRVIAVTGAGRGIGASIAVRAAAEGARVVVNDLGSAVDGSGSDKETAAGVVSRITGAGGSAVANSGDISDHDQAGALIQQAVDTYGRLDVLINVAGILRDKMIFNMTPEEWGAVVKVHLRGTYNTTKHASVYWRSLKQADAHHRLINFTSGSALHGAPGQPNYAAAKMGIAGLTYSCAAALKRYGVTSNAISPDASTRMTDSMGEHRREDQDVRSPDNIAPIVLYLASERSDWCNGQILYSSGPDIGLFNVPSLVSEIFTDGPWELGSAFDQIESAFPAAVMPNAVPAMTGAATPNGAS
jgi:NAD(P)-dependent dehydrogenase (short-subunit alcohol dehydrogenase family)